MRQFENAFDLELHQNHIRNLAEAGFTVHTGHEIDLASGRTTYTAVVIPISEYDYKLRELKAGRYSSWLTVYRSMSPEQRALPMDSTMEEIPEALFAGDPRRCSSDTAWGALVGAEEMAVKLQDAAPPDEYIELSNTAWHEGIELAML